MVTAIADRFKLRSTFSLMELAPKSKGSPSARGGCGECSISRVQSGGKLPAMSRRVPLAQLAASETYLIQDPRDLENGLGVFSAFVERRSMMSTACLVVTGCGPCDTVASCNSSDDSILFPMSCPGIS